MPQPGNCWRGIMWARKKLPASKRAARPNSTFGVTHLCNAPPPPDFAASVATSAPSSTELIDLRASQQKGAHPIHVTAARAQLSRRRSDLLNRPQPSVRINVRDHALPRLCDNRFKLRPVEQPIVDSPSQGEREKGRPRNFR